MEDSEIKERLEEVSNYAFNKLSYPESCITSLYNRYPTFDRIDISTKLVNEDGSLNYKIVDSSKIGI